MHDRPARRPPLARLVGTLALMVLGVVTGTSTPAAAHSDLISSEPGYGDILPAIPQPVLLHFDEPVELTASVVELSRDNDRIDPPKPVHVGGNKRTVAVRLTTSGAGRYLLRWFFFGYDGHLMAGELAFQVKPGAAPVPAPSSVVSPPSSAGVAAAAPISPERGSTRFAPSQNPFAGSFFGQGGEAFDAAGDLPESFLAKGSSEAAATPTPAPVPSFRPGQTAGAEAAVRFGGYVSLAILVGGTCFIVQLWPEGGSLGRVRRLLWLGLAGALSATVLTLGLKGAGLRGLTPVSALRPDVVSTIFGTHFANVLLLRAGLLAAAAPLLLLLARRPERAVSSGVWRFSASVVGAGVVATYCLTGHAYSKGVGATLAAFVHVVGATMWLGGLIMLAVVVLPRRCWEEARIVIPAFSALAEKAVAAMVLAGVALFFFLDPAWSDLSASGWGQLLFVKLGLVVLVLGMARQARAFTHRHLVRPTGNGVALGPLIATVAAEIVLAAGVLTATALLVSRNPPG